VFIAHLFATAKQLHWRATLPTQGTSIKASRISTALLSPKRV